jgi:hypothetical protein
MKSLFGAGNSVILRTDDITRRVKPTPFADLSALQELSLYNEMPALGNRNWPVVYDADCPKPIFSPWKILKMRSFRAINPPFDQNLVIGTGG